MNDPFSLKDKTVLVTGASSGIGKAIAVECSKVGATLCISGRNEERLNSTFSELEGEGHIQITADLKNEEEIKRIADTVPVLNGVVHCAGIGKPLPFQFSGKDVIDEVIQINFTAHALLSQHLLRSKKVTRGGSIVFISSISGVFISSVGGSVYSASKGAVNGLVKGMAIELAPKLIRVNSVNPGMIDTNIYSEGIITEEQLKEDALRYPLKRYGKPEEVAWAVIYLLSDASAWTTGSSLLIDGGYTLL